MFVFKITFSELHFVDYAYLTFSFFNQWFSLPLANGAC